MYCGKCGAKIKEGNKFCIYCGAELDKQVLENEDIQEEKIVEVKEETSNADNKEKSEETENNKNDKKISTVWLDLITAFWFFIGIYNAVQGFSLLADYNDEFSGMFGFLSLITGVIQFVTFFLVHMRQKLGYYFFIAVICMSSFANSIIRFMIAPASESNDYSVIIITGIITLIVYGLPNFLYISKRKSLFGIEENVEEEENDEL